MLNKRARSGSCLQTADFSPSLSCRKVWIADTGTRTGPHKATLIPSFICLLEAAEASKLKPPAASVCARSTTVHHRSILYNTALKVSGNRTQLERHARARTAAPLQPVQQPTAATAAASKGDAQTESRSRRQQQQQQKAHVQQPPQQVAAVPEDDKKRQRHQRQVRKPKQQLLSEAQQLRQQLRQLQQGQAQQYDQAGFRAAAAGSTALLLSWLQNALLQLQHPPTMAATSDISSTSANFTAAVPSASAAATDHQLNVRGWLAALTDVLITISWHCKTHDLLPGEARQLQQLLLSQLLPLLGPHLRRLPRKALARAVFALGSCHASLALIHDSSSSSSTNLSQGSSRDGTSAVTASAVDHQLGSAREAAASTPASSANVGRNGDPPTAGAGNSSIGRQQDAAAHQRQQPGDGREQQQQQQQPLLESDAVQSPAQSEPESAHQQEQQQQQISSRQQCWSHLSSEQWVQVLLPLLVPQKLSTGAVLAAWQGCALHQLTPPHHWLQAASTAAYHALLLHKLDHSDTAALLQSFTQLSFSPPAWLMHELVRHVQQHLPFFTPADLAGVLSGLQVLSFRPSNTFLRCWCESSSRLLPGMTVSQLAAAAAALSWAGYQTQPWWTLKFLAACQPLLPTADVDDLLLLLHAGLSMRPQPPHGWLHQCYCHLRAQQQQLTLSQVADAAHVLATLQLPSSFTAHHRHWLAACLRHLGWRRLTAATGSGSSRGKVSSSGDGDGTNSDSSLSRSELLYTLYAAGKLQVAPGARWLAAALQQLHELLPGAGPAELVASFVVFAHFSSSNNGRQHQLGKDDSSLSMPAPGTAVEVDSITPVASSGSALWLQDCLAAAVGCVAEFSDEGLLQLLLTSADVGMEAVAVSGASSDAVIDGSSDSSDGSSRALEEVPPGGGAAVGGAGVVGQGTEGCVRVLADTLAGRMMGMSLLQLSRVVKVLEAHSMSGSSIKSSAHIRKQSQRPGWYLQLVQQGKAAMAAKA